MGDVDLHIDSKSAVQECKNCGEDEEWIDFVCRMLDHTMFGDFMSGA
jgi:predicted RNA-binding Zn-ribbon protein involved in translation (DUF1610 family)